MSKERIMTRHPEGKKGVNILKSRYDQMKDFIIDTIQKHDEISFKQLAVLADEQLAKTFDGKVRWYLVTVKLDLEARGILERIPKTSPHKLKIKD